MATDASDVLSTPTMTMAGLFVAGLSLGAVYAFNYTQLGRQLWPGDNAAGAGVVDSENTHTHTHTMHPGSSTSARRSADRTGDAHAEEDGEKSTSGMRKRRGRRGKGKGEGRDEAEAEAEAESKGESKGQVKGGSRGKPAPVVPFPRVIPGDFDGANADVHPKGQSGPVVKTQKKKKQKKQKQKGKDKDGEDVEAGSETGKEVDVGRTAVRSGDSTDASVSFLPSMSGDTLSGSSRAMAKNLGTGTRPAPPPQPRSSNIPSSLSFDTDSSWTHVDRRRPKTSKSTDGQARGLVDAMEMANSDLASTASDSPVAERMDNVTMDMRGARADLAERTLAEKLVPRPKKMGVDDMLEQPDFPTLARVMRIQPRADETPVPGFSWEDYGDVVEDSVLVHDADEEDEGEWGVVKSRNRARPPQTTSASSSTRHAPAAPETMTKKQRQNARKRELAKAAKAEAEVARLEGLAKHKHELQRLRIIEQSRQGGGKQPSGGMRATVDDRGKLVWE